MGQLLVNGLTTGLILALPALALALSFSVLRFANYAIGSYVTVGAFVTWWANVALALPFWVAAIIGSVAVASLAVSIDALVYRHMRERSGLTLLVASMGVAIALENVVRLFAGNSPRSFDVPVARPQRFFDIRVNQEQLIILITVLGALILVWLVFRFTRLGRAMRAVADNAALASVRGIARGRVIAVVWALSGGLSALAGVLIGLDTSIEPQMGWNYLLPIFTAAILGGIASPMAAVAGALVLGMAEEVSTLFLPPHYRMIVAFVIMAALLMLRPWGLFGTKWVQR
ncbi:branched-chain amino acid ABC transporter permease [Tianweitania populi]|uniref:Branched-chain amino acid ABC transporter permease n=1 Tax=Tianweitania populi TaxID=1607949 RepID=A0A8J3DTV5_9HYPH|nr:branched-chain amino acid ABC transporter permease [Tianweitania populi]GHD24650.1 branched-chain amino acid ABC transporter permease [Tianweitania populi]